MKKDRSLLFGLLAVSMKKVRPDKLSEVARRTQTSSESDLGKSLVDEGLLSVEDKKKLDKLVEMSLASHDGDASATIQDFGNNPEKLDSLVDSMDDFIAAFEKSAGPPETGAGSEGPVDSILGDFSEADSMDGSAPPPDSLVGGNDDDVLLDSLLSEDDGAQTHVNQTGGTGDRGSVGDIVGHDAPDSFFESIGSTGTQIMSPVQAAAELDESEIVPAVAEHEGRYEMVREFAKGGMGKISLVHDTHLGRDVALKQLLQSHIMPGTEAGAPTTAILTIPIIARFLQEARITGQLEHPSIIPVYELGYRADGSLYYTMKLIRGQSMHDFLKEAKTLNDRLPLLTHFLDLCQAISYAHSRGVIHRDLKPMNLMIGEFGETVVIDWGIAKVRGEDDIHARGLEATVTAMRVSSAEATAKTMYGQTIGSPYFMPAEQAMGRTDLIDERSDIYSLGAVLYTILSGKMPYAGNNVREFMGKVGQVEPKPVRMLEPDVRPELAAICHKAMALVPENRYQSAKELTEEIQKYLSGGMVDAYTYSSVEMAKRFIKKHKKALAVVAVFIVSAVGFGIFHNINITIQKNAALASKQVAVEERIKAEASEQVAVEERVKAEASEKKAVLEKDRAEQELYYANIANTRFNINEQQMAKARELLANCEPASLRQWEWGHLEAVAHSDIMTLDRGGQLTAFTADASGLLTGTNRGTLSLHDLQTGELLHEFIRWSGYGFAKTVSADGSRVALRGDDSVHVWDVASKEELLRFDEPESINTQHHLDMSSDGRVVAALNSDKVTRVWDINTGEVVLTIEECVTSEGFGLRLSADGSQLLIARKFFGDEGWERRFEVFAIPSGEVLGSHTFSKDSVLSIHVSAFSPDNTHLVFGMDDRLRIWDIASFSAQKDIIDYTFRKPDIVAYSPDGKLIAAGDNEGDLLLCDARGNTVHSIPKAHEGFIRSVRFSHDGSRLATASDDRTVRLWSVPDLLPLKTYRGHGANVFTVAFSQDDSQLASSDVGGESKVWDLSADLDFAPNELAGFKNATYSTEGDIVAGTTETQIVLWHARSGHKLHTLESHEAAAKAVALNSSGTLVASVGQEGGEEKLRIWDVSSGKLLTTIATSLGDSERLDFVLKDSHVLISAGKSLVKVDRSGATAVPLLDTATSEQIAGATLNYQISPAGSQIALCFPTASGTFQANIVELSDGAITATHSAENLTGLQAFFTQTDGTLLLARTDRTEDGKGIDHASLALWNTTSGDVTTPVFAHEGSEIHKIDVSYAVASPDGTRIATGDKQGRVALWKIENNAIIYLAPLRGHTDEIKGMDFSADGKRLVTGSNDRTFKIWDVKSGVLILTLQEAAVRANVQVAQPTQVAFSADGLHLATITEPPVSPMILHAFSTDMADYPDIPVDENATGTEEEKSQAHLEKQMEAYKRQYWRE